MSAFFDALKAERERLLPFADTEKLDSLKAAHTNAETMLHGERNSAHHSIAFSDRAPNVAEERRSLAHAAAQNAFEEFSHFEQKHKFACARIAEIDGILDAENNYHSAAQAYRDSVKATKTEEARGEHLSALVAEMEGEVTALQEESNCLMAEHTEAQIKARLDGKPSPAVPKRAAQAHIEAESRKAALEQLRDMHKQSVADLAALREGVGNKKKLAHARRAKLAEANYMAALETIREAATEFTAAQQLAGRYSYDCDKPPAIVVHDADVTAAKNLLLSQMDK